MKPNTNTNQDLRHDGKEGYARRFLSVVKKNYSAWLIILPSIIVFYFFVWRPLLIGISMSFFRLKGFTPTEFVGLKNYFDVIRNTLFLKTLGNTMSYVFWSLIIGALPPFIIAIMVNEAVHLKGYFKFAMYFPAIIPSIAVSMIWYYLYQPGDGGILNMLLGKLGLGASAWLQNSSMTIPLIVISMTWRGCGATMVMYLATLQGINQELYEATRIDGAGFFRRIRYVTIPHMSGVLLLLLIRQIISVFQILEQPLAMTGGGPNYASLSLSLQTYNYNFVYGQTDKALATGGITFALLLILTVIYFQVDKKISD